MPGKAAKVTITERQQEILDELSRSRSEPYFLRQRATIILLAFAGLLNEEIAPHVDLERHRVGIWRARWADAFDRLVLVECLEGPRALRKAVRELLADAPRSGSPGKFTPEQLALIFATACEAATVTSQRKPMVQMLTGAGNVAFTTVPAGAVTLKQRFTPSFQSMSPWQMNV